ncbi:hypothetical protein OAK17_05610 [Alphaproteobacteria bacterium]|nr:hypothetical protein [Alphaproteobacteria bacterium]
MISFYRVILLVLYFITFSCLSLQVSAQSQIIDPIFPDTTQQILKKSMNSVLSKKNLEKRDVLLKRLSDDCNSDLNKPIPPECRKKIKKESINQQVKNIESKTTDLNPNLSSPNISNQNIPSISVPGGGVSIGTATLGFTAFVAIAGGAILSFLAIGSYGDDNGSSSGITSAASTE